MSFVVLSTLLTEVEKFTPVSNQLQVLLHYNFYQSLVEIKKQTLFLLIVTNQDMNHREVGLHNIIKSQQAKINQLKQELALVSQVTETRLIEAEKYHLSEIKEKNTLIQYLKEELQREKQRTKVDQETNLVSSRLKLDKETLEQENIKLKKKCSQLENQLSHLQQKMRNAVQDYEVKLRVSSQKNQTLLDELHHSQQSQTNIEVEIEKLTRFYKSSIFDIPKRKETLLWVDNLIKFMEHAESTSAKNHQELVKNIRQNLQQLRVDFKRTISEVSLSEERIINQSRSIYQKTINIMEQKLLQQSNIGSNLQELFRIGKNQKSQAFQKEFQQMKKSYEQLKQSSQNQIEILEKRNKELENQKRTLMLGFQQIKTFLENKQATHKEQIQHLKQTINDLIESGEMRQRQFQEQIQLMSQQVSSISDRYYENIQYPMAKVNERVTQEIARVKEEMLKINQNVIFHKSLEKLNERIPDFIQCLQIEQNEQNAIQAYLNHGNQLLRSAVQLIYEISCRSRQGVSFIDSKISMNSQAKYNSDSIIQEPMKNQTLQVQDLKTAVEKIQTKQKQNRQKYQLNLLKKHNHKLNQMVNSLEKKIKGLSKGNQDKALNNYLKSQRKVMELEAEIQQLKESNQQYETILRQEVEKLQVKCRQAELAIRSSKKQQVAVLEAIEQLQERHQIIFKIVKDRHEKTTELQKSLNIINNMLIKPAQTFESLVKQVAEMSNKSSFVLPMHSTPTQRINKTSVFSEESLRTYQQILSRRNQVNNSASKYIVDLIKTVRQTFPLRQNKRKQNQSSQGKQNEQKPLVKGRNSQFEKKCKEVQTQFSRYKNQLTKKIQTVMEQLALIEAFNQKKEKNSINTCRKIENIVESRLNTLLVQLKSSEESQKKEFSTFTGSALKDTQSKLKESIRQNEGLRKEMALLYKLTHLKQSDQETQK